VGDGTVGDAMTTEEAPMLRSPNGTHAATSVPAPDALDETARRVTHWRTLIAAAVALLIAGAIAVLFYVRLPTRDDLEKVRGASEADVAELRAAAADHERRLTTTETTVREIVPRIEDTLKRIDQRLYELRKEEP
jgi:predicted membrane-bound mannosyltransferase